MIKSAQQIRTVLIPAEAVLLLRTSTHFSDHFNNFKISPAPK
jgi:hypothetical protein